MKSRSFALAGLLRLRGLQEAQAAGELAAANHKVREHAALHQAVRESIAAPEQAPVDSSTLMALVAARASTRGALLELEGLTDQLETDAVRVRERHRSARVELKALEKLADRHLSAIRHDALVREQALLDDLGATSAFEGKKA